MGVITLKYGWIQNSKPVLLRICFLLYHVLLFLLSLDPFSSILSCSSNIATNKQVEGKEISPLLNNSRPSHLLLGSIVSASVIHWQDFPQEGLESSQSSSKTSGLANIPCHCLPVWPLCHACSISIHRRMLRESIVDLGELIRMMKSYMIPLEGGSKARDTEEAEINGTTLISAEQFDFAPLMA